ncbi:MAG: TerD family protein [Candidatus Competibacteraceae bacterium]
MTQALPKGGNAAIAQADPTARALFVGLSWEAPPAMSSVVIDASVFLLNADGVVRDDSDFVFYNQEADISGAVYRLPTDELDRTQDQDGFVVVLSALSEDVRRLAFCLTLDTASTSNATFGALSWVQARLVNHDSGQEFLRYRDNDDVGPENCLDRRRVYRHPNGWKFKAVGAGLRWRLPQALAAHFGVCWLPMRIRPARMWR